MLVDDAYVRWFDDDQHQRGMTDLSVDEAFEWADRDTDKAPVPRLARVAPVVQLFDNKRRVQRGIGHPSAGEAGPAAVDPADGPPWKDAA